MAGEFIDDAAALTPMASHQPYRPMMPSHSAPQFVDDAAPQPREARGLLDAFHSGVENSVIGLAAYKRLPDVVLNQRDATLMQRLAAQAGQVIFDTPIMALGSAGGAAAGGAAGSEVPVIGNITGAVLGGGFGAFGLPAAIRTALMERYRNGEVQSVGEFLHRTWAVFKDSVKEGLVGATTAGAGLATKMALPMATGTAAKIATGAAPIAAETVTMASMPALMDGRLPEPREFMDAAIMVGGMHAAPKVAGKLMTVFEKTGKTPIEVVADARLDPTIAEDLLAGVEKNPTLAEPGAVNDPAARLQEVSEPAGRAGSRTTGEAGAEAEGRRGGHPELGAERFPTTTLPDDPKFHGYQLRNIPVLNIGGQEITAGPRPPYFSFHGNKAQDGQVHFSSSPTNVAGDGVYITQTFGVASAKAHTGEAGQVLSPYVDTSKFVSFDARISRDYTPAEAAAFGIQVEGSVSGREMLVHLNAEHGAGKGVHEFLKQLGFNAVAFDYTSQEHPSWSVFDPTVFKRVADTKGWDAAEVARRQAFDPRPIISPEIPRAYQPLADQVAVHEAVPGLAETVAQEFFGPVAKVEGEPRPTQVNYKYLNTPDQVNGALAKISELNLAEIQKQRRGTVGWEQTQAEAGKVIQELLGAPDLFVSREPGTAAGAAELLARKQMLEGAANDMAAKAKAFAEAGPAATPEMVADFLESINRAAMIQSEFLGARAEAGRALNILKETKTTAERAEAIQRLTEAFKDQPEALAKAISEVNTKEGMLKLARDIHKATTLEKFIEVWKSGLVSGPVTNAANLMSNFTYAAMQPLVDAVAVGISPLTKGKEGVHFTEPLARVIGDLHGVFDMATVAEAWTALTVDAPNTKTQTRQAIEGTKGYIIRTPFRALEAMDVLFRTMNERGEAWALAAREAAKEGHNPLTREFRERVAELAQNPTEPMIEKIEKFGARSVFKAPLGDFGKWLNKGAKVAPVMEFILPFRTTPLNIFKEMTRYTPAAPVIPEWRADFAAGGARGARAAAEVAIGTAFATAAIAGVFAGDISGAGDPDPQKRRTNVAGGWQPYSMKIGDKYYSYQRLQPIGTLVGMAADMGEMWQYMEHGEKEKAANVLGAAFANAVTNQTFLQGLSQLTAALAHPERSMPRFLQTLTASVVPGLAGQTAQLMDPYIREANSIKEAVQNRIPGLREDLAPKRDPFGEPVPNADRLGWISPVQVKGTSQDKVRAEALRLNRAGFDVGPAAAPKSIHMPDGGQGKIGKVELDPHQRDVYGDVAGHLAYNALHTIVNSPGWDYMPDAVKERAYKTVFEHTRKAGEMAAVSPEQRQKEVQRIVGEVSKRLSK